MGRTNVGGKFYIAVETDGITPQPQNFELSNDEFGGLNWQNIPKMGSMDDTGVQQNTASYPTWDQPLTAQKKGQATGVSFKVRFLDAPSDGMTAMKKAAAHSDPNNYAFKTQWPDGSIEYNRGEVSAPLYPKGSNEDFVEAVFTISLNQIPHQDPWTLQRLFIRGENGLILPIWDTSQMSINSE